VLQGLNGIPVKHENKIRPLLFAQKAEIVKFAEKNEWHFREDSSNKSDRYQRNLIRNQVIPQLKNINPRLTETVFQGANYRKFYMDFFLQEAESFITGFVQIENELQQISISALPEKYFNPAFFNYWLSGFGFTFQQSLELVNCLKSTESKTFLSQTHQIFKEREKVVLREIKATEIYEAAYIHAPGNALQFGGKSFVCEIISPENVTDFAAKNIAYFDLDKIQFPLQVRTWETGYYFIPFGLGKRKKISDFYKDQQFSSDQKAAQLLIVNAGGEILWVVGYRTDDRFRVSEATKQVLRVAVK
ncbi:MAG: hypothetical protein EOP53_11885, partial [Sphingobacteriales bacterium]